MSFLQPVWNAIGARVAADTGTGGLRNVASPLVTACYNNEMPSTRTLPFLVYDVLDAFQIDAERTAIYRVSWRMNTYVERKGASSMATANLIQARIIGDWWAQAYGTAPTYGFARYTPSLSGGAWTGGMIEHVRSGEAHELAVWHFYEEFRMLVSKAGA